MVREILLLLVMFWNVENFFDPFPPGDNSWTWKRFQKKRDDIARTVALVKEKYDLFPSLIGLAEVENYFVLKQLTQNTILASLEYNIIHNDSPDRRGIDVALLYRKEEFRPLKAEFFQLDVPTRELLYTKGIFRGLDTLHIFVAHWPSKLGGKEAGRNRIMAAELLNCKSDSILAEDSRAKIVVMGDFNDGPGGEAVSCVRNLVNMSAERFVGKGNGCRGTYKYKGEWSIIDHFMVSGAMGSGGMDGEGGLQWLFCYDDAYEIFADDFLLEEDRSYLGMKVRRSMIGPVYNGGVSDHLPVLLKVYGYPFDW